MCLPWALRCARQPLPPAGAEQQQQQPQLRQPQQRCDSAAQRRALLQHSAAALNSALLGAGIEVQVQGMSCSDVKVTAAAAPVPPATVASSALTTSAESSDTGQPTILLGAVIAAVIHREVTE